MRTVGVIGTGIMGAGIAQVAATHGATVYLLDVSPEVVRKAIDGIGKNFARLVEKGKLTAAEREAALGRLHVADGPEALAGCDLVIEAVSENLEVKTKVLAPIAAKASSETMFASNTSSLSITKIGRAIGESQRLAGMHFFNPAPLMPLVEVIAGDDTDPAVVDRVAATAATWGKTVVRAKDTPGFIVNRVARGYYLEALRLLGEGVASIAEIDAAMRHLGGFRMGPFELMDLVGIDVNYSVTCSVWEQMGRPARLTPHPIQADLFQRGHLGRKTKRGFYDYSSDPPMPAVQAERKPFVLPEAARNATAAFVERATDKRSTEVEHFVFAGILAMILNEAALAQEQGVATRNDIDTAMKLGTNYPRGPFEWVERIGSECCGNMLTALWQTGRRFEPASTFTIFNCPQWGD